MVDDKTALKILETYGEAWVEQDAKKILSIFTEDATYSEYAFKDHYNGHEGISEYWKEKVVKEQSNIKFNLLTHYITGNTIIAEFESWFDSKVKGSLHMKTIAVMEIKGDKIISFREYWHSEQA